MISAFYGGFEEKQVKTLIKSIEIRYVPYMVPQVEYIRIFAL